MYRERWVNQPHDQPNTRNIDINVQTIRGGYNLKGSISTSNKKLLVSVENPFFVDVCKGGFRSIVAVHTALFPSANSAAKAPKTVVTL